MILKIENLSFAYENSKEKVLENFNMELEKGDICGLLGDSGSGKSTILRLIAGLEIPISGEITVDNNIVFDHKTFVLPEKRKIGMIFQDYGLFPHLNVYNNIKFGLHKFSAKEKVKRIDEMLNLINMLEFKKRFPYQLSGGQQQRVALARSLAPVPKLLLMDEPFSNLDATLKVKMRKEIKDILKNQNMTCVFVSHDKEDILDICDKQVLI